MPSPSTYNESTADRFYDYLDFCDENGPIGVGDYLELIKESAPMSWSRLLFDLMDTYDAGMLVKVRTDNGSIAYVRRRDNV